MFIYLEKVFDNFYFLALIGLFLVISFITKLIIDKIVLALVKKYVENNKIHYDNILLENHFFTRCSYIVFAIILKFFIPGFKEYGSLLETFNNIFIVLVFTSIIFSLLTSLSIIVNMNHKDKNLPINTISQVLKIIVVVVSSILIISSLLHQSPIAIFSGIGALSALTMLIFKDTILGFVAGIQISLNDTVRVGDWIEMPKYDADGDVIDITLNVVKIKNFDSTITNVPTYAFISDSFKNWRNVMQSGVRRIKRTINISVDSVEFLTDSDIKKYKEIDILKSYLENKENEIGKYNELKSDINKRRLTNLGTFRIYILEYLKNNTSISSKMIKMVRQLQSTEIGIPLEIYAFANTIKWEEYETIQSDLFDHIVSMAPYFNIDIFQKVNNKAIEKRTKTI